MGARNPQNCLSQWPSFGLAEISENPAFLGLMGKNQLVIETRTKTPKQTEWGTCSKTLLLHFPLLLNEEIAYKAGLPVLVPPDTDPTPEPHDASLDDSCLRKIIDEHPERDIDSSVPRIDAPERLRTNLIDL